MDSFLIKLFPVVYEGNFLLFMNENFKLRKIITTNMIISIFNFLHHHYTSSLLFLAFLLQRCAQNIKGVHKIWLKTNYFSCIFLFLARSCIQRSI